MVKATLSASCGAVWTEIWFPRSRRSNSRRPRREVRELIEFLLRCKLTRKAVDDRAEVLEKRSMASGVRKGET